MHVHKGPDSLSRLCRYCVGLAGGRVATGSNGHSRKKNLRARAY